MTTTRPASSEKEMHKKWIIRGERFIQAFYRLVQTVKIHQGSNPILMDCAKEFNNAVLQWCDEDDNLKVQVSRYRFYLQNEKLLYRKQFAGVINNALDFFERLGLHGLRFYMSINRIPPERVLAFGNLLNRAEQQDTPLEWLVEKFTEEDFPWIEIIHDIGTHLQGADRSRKETGRKNYSYLLASVKEVTKKLTSGQRAGLRKPVRMIQNMIDLMMVDEPLFLALSTVRIYDDYTYTHSVNVALLSMYLGKQIGISRSSLERLGICGLLHDMGKVEIPKQILNKPGKLTAEEFEVVKKHSINSVRLIVKIEASQDRKSKMLLPPFEHHLKYDLSGYPQSRRKKPLSLFGRIIAIADVYDALTSPRIYRLHAVSPDRVLELMLEKAEKDFDPILLKVFINMLGIYPIGTILQMDKGRLCIVIKTPNGIDAGARPHALMLVRDEQGEFKKGKVVDLSEKDPDTGNYLINIIKSLHPSVCGIHPARFLI